MEILPKDFDGRVENLYSSLQEGIEKLLDTARKQEVLLPPYGCPLPYSPYIDPNDPGSGADTDADENAQFTYDYGFNPLMFLSRLLKQSHPDSVVARKQERLRISAELTRKATFARRQTAALDYLRTESKRLCSGISSELLSVPISPTSLLVVFKALKPGQIILQACQSVDFAGRVLTISESIY